MASFRKRGSGGWQAQVRRKGYPAQSKSFSTRAAAVQWVRSIEYEMDQGLFVSRNEAETTTFAELLTRYLTEYTPHKKGAGPEACRIGALLRHPLAKRFIGTIRGVDIARYRDERLQKVTGGSIRREQPLPAEPETISMFVASQAADGLNPSTITRRLSAIRLVHLGAGYPSPHNTIKVIEVMRGIRRDWARPPERKAPAIVQEIKEMVDATDKEMAKGLRDRALLLIGFSGAFRRSELVALNTWNLEYRDEGVKVTIQVSKTDQESKGQVIAIVRQPDSPYCPVRALDDWLTIAKIEHGALFRRMHRGDNIGTARLSAQSVATIIKEYAYKVGLDSTRYSGHSLRRGFLTSAARNRASIFKMADQSRHKSLDVLRQYVQVEELFEDNAGQGLLSSK